MLNFQKKTDVKNLVLQRRNIIVSYPIANISSEINNAAKVFNLGIDIFIFDANFLTSKSALELGSKLIQICSLFDILFFVKDRCDLAKILKADGIYLDENSYDIKSAKKILNDDIIFGTKIDNEHDDIDEFDFVISSKNLNLIKPCYCNVLTCPKTLSQKVFINSSDIQLIKKHRKMLYGTDIENEIS